MTNEQTTGDDGKATFQLEYGDYTATITKDGYVTKTENIAFRSNHKNFSITLVEDTPTGTGTVTVTVQDNEQNPLEFAYVGLNIDSDTAICGGNTGSDGTVILETLTEQGEPTGTVADVPYGDYLLFDSYYDDSTGTDYTYSGELTVDGDETVTITLTEEEGG